ncbi:urokinase plasminogen activator surface receptor-like, partial [Clarias magur]
LSLTCMQFIPLTNSPEEITCADQCLTSTTSIYTSDGSVPTELSVKTCGTPETCVRGSMNVGVMKMIANTKCCKTNKCNTETMPALSRQASNGKMCYTCEDDNCTRTMECEGNEDRCITAS